MLKKIKAFFYDFCSTGFLGISFLIITQNTIFISWNMNSEDDLKGYKLYYGNESKKYQAVIDAGLMTDYTFDDLQAGKDYYFTVTAYDTNYNESEYSEEVFVSLKNSSATENLYKVNFKNSCYNFPNPFVPGKELTAIRYVLESDTYITIKIYDVTGRHIRTVIESQPRTEGEHTADKWDGKDNNGNYVPNSVYYGKIETEYANKFITIVVLK